MKREEVKEQLINISKEYNNILIELPTGHGKSKIALDIIDNTKKKSSILIVIPRLVLIQNWKDEIKKWGMTKYLKSITFTTYVSLPKHEGKWDIIIYDECHHLSERCRESLTSFTIGKNILLSATVKLSLKDEIREIFDNLYCYKVTMKESIESKVLPTPTIYLIPLTLNTTQVTETIIKNPKGKTPAIITDWKNRWSYMKQQINQVHIKCTEWQYYLDMDSNIEWYKKRAMAKAIFKNKWLKLCGDRLKWLSNTKNQFVYDLLQHLKNERVLTFCGSVEQTEVLGSYCINSKNKSSISYLNKFNEGKIKHITACNMLNEGCNLENCRIGVFSMLNSSETMIIQKIGRILRHPKPIIIIPYYKDTREEEIALKMVEEQNTMTYTITNIKDIKL